jgi:hypothetical protein
LSRIFCWILESGWNSWGSLLFLSFHQLWIPPDSIDETSQNSRHFQGPTKLFNFTPNYLSAAEKIAQNPSKLPAKKSSGKIALTIEHFHDSSKQKRAIKNFRSVEHFSSSEFEIGCQVLFLTSCITHKIPDKNSCFRAVQCPGMKTKSAGNF